MYPDVKYPFSVKCVCVKIRKFPRSKLQRETIKYAKHSHSTRQLKKNSRSFRKLRRVQPVRPRQTNIYYIHIICRDAYTTHTHTHRKLVRGTSCVYLTHNDYLDSHTRFLHRPLTYLCVCVVCACVYGIYKISRHFVCHFRKSSRRV